MDWGFINVGRSFGLDGALEVVLLRRIGICVVVSVGSWEMS